ncbi:MAG: hypothetical protein VKQ33_00360 [Candidatus Sericytochromatia bacterium]|nr:hypothetical protein [Candidatus Sericytochromatia bacterium]
MRLAWYALGGGLGHLQRALAVLRWLRPRLGAEAPLVVTSSAYAHLALAEGLPCLRLPGAHEAQALPEGVASGLARQALAALGPIGCLVVDTFPDGLHGELTPAVLAGATHKVLVARPGGGTPEASPAWGCYDRVVAPLPVAPWAGVEAVGWVLARRPGEALAPADARRRLGLPAVADRPLIVAMHAGDPGEVVGLFGLVRDASERLGQPHDLRFFTPLPLGGWLVDPRVVHPWPASELLEAVDLLVTGGGYNATAEADAFGVRALQVAFRRSHDDQAARVGQRARAAQPGWGVAEWTAALAAALAAPRPTPLSPADTDGARRLALTVADLLR